MAKTSSGFRSGTGGSKPAPRAGADRNDEGTGKQAVPQSLGMGSTYKGGK